MKRLLAVEEEKAEVQMVPLIDTLFLLLIVFISAMLHMQIQKGLPVQLPGVSGPAAQTNTDRNEVITITETNQVHWNRDVVTLADLKQRLHAALKESNDLRIVIRGDEHADHGMTVRVLEAVHECGKADVVFEVRADENAQDLAKKERR